MLGSESRIDRGGAGDRVRYAPNRIMINSAEALHGKLSNLSPSNLDLYSEVANEYHVQTSMVMETTSRNFAVTVC